MAGDTDMKPHRATYESVIGMLKYGAVACAGIAALVIWLIAGHK
ncbi:MAG: aa3-type cytochrome c oxidase subunit IV [Pseudomonadota bacterium]